MSTTPGDPPSWRFWLRYLRHARGFLLILFGVAMVEIIVGSWLLPRVIPAHWYFGLYTPAGAAIKGRMFAEGEFNVIPDPELGWKNHPGAGHGQFDTGGERIAFDAYGSRSHRGIQPGQRLPKRVLLFGDSRINGWTYVANDETLNAWLEREDPELESLNLATDLYGLDQIYLAMQRTLPEFQPDAVVVGLGSDEDNLLDCHCIVFKENRLEHDLPLLKPRFVLAEDGALQLQTPPAQALLRDLPANPRRFVEYLREHDGCYGRFERFQQWEFTPLLASFSFIQQKLRIAGGRRWDFGQFRSLENLALTSALLKAMRELAEQHHTRLLFLLLPTAYEFQGSKSFVLGQVRKVLAHQDETFLDGLEVLRTEAPDQFLFHDDVHLSSEANRVLARAVLQRLTQ